MTALIAGLTLRQLLGQRRTIIVALLGALPVLVAVITRLAADRADHTEIGSELLEGMVVHLVLPLVTLVLGTAALGQELEDGTVLYLVARPLRRSQIIAGKLLATWGASLAVVLASALGVGAALLLGQPDGARLTAAFALASVLGALAYLALFLCLSIVFNRALIIGLIYVFVWEAAITALAPGTQNLSIREYTMGIVGAVADVPPAVLQVDLGAPQAIALLTLVTVAALAYATRALARYQVTSST